MPVHTAQSPEFIASVQHANARRMAMHQQAAGARICFTDNPEVLRQYLNGMQTRHKDAFPLSDNLIAHFSSSKAERKTDQCNVFENHLARELRLQDDEDSVPRSLHYNENIHPRSIYPTSRRKSENIFYILEQAGYEGEEGF